jgi:hypothetical protein
VRGEKEKKQKEVNECMEHSEGFQNVAAIISTLEHTVSLCQLSLKECEKSAIGMYKRERRKRAGGEAREKREERNEGFQNVFIQEY